MTQLPDTLRKNGFDYVLVHREGNRAIYRQQVDEELQYFEVMRIKIKPASIFKGVSYPEREVFPSDEEFGTSAFSCRTLESAMIHFNQL